MGCGFGLQRVNCILDQNPRTLSLRMWLHGSYMEDWMHVRVHSSHSRP